MSGVQKTSSALGKVSGAITGTKLTLKQLMVGGGWRIVHDGNLMETLVLKSPGTVCMGEDVHGNKYFEDSSLPSGQHRWVLYANKHKQTGLDPTTVPPEWHGWLHFMTDVKPGDKPASYPIYAIEPHGRPNPTGTSKRYLPKGAWGNTQRRHWQKFTAWSPASHTSVRGAVPDSA